MAAVDDGAGLRLATYGTLGPGRLNHGQLSELPGRWLVGQVRSERLEARWGAKLGFPGLVLDPDGPLIEVEVFESPCLPEHWNRLDAEHWNPLDAFEGPGYRRVAVDVETPDGDLPAGRSASAPLRAGEALAGERSLLGPEQTE